MILYIITQIKSKLLMGCIHVNKRREVVGRRLIGNTNNTYTKGRIVTPCLKGVT